MTIQIRQACDVDMTGFEEKPLEHVPHVLYVGPFGFPHGGAAARRILGNALSFKRCGLRVSIGSGQMPTPGARASDEYCGIPVHSLGERRAEHHSQAFKRFRYSLMGRRTVQWLEGLTPRPCAVVLYSGYSPYLLNLLPWCRRNSVPLIFDAVEWYEASSVWAALSSPYQWNIELAMRYLARHLDGAITISSYLQRHFERLGVRTALVPPSLDSRAVEAKRVTTPSGPLTVSYAGNPGTKDLLNEVVEAVLRIDSEGAVLRLHIAGVEPASLLEYTALKARGLRALPGSLVAFGGLPHAEALDMVRQSDFSSLLRRDSRVARAGFPTKFVESLSVGTPVIANLTSDLGRYLLDGETGLVCDGEDADAMERGLLRALETMPGERAEMRTRARAVAETHFDYRVHSATLRSLLTEIGAC